MDDDALAAALADERRALADLFDSLSPAQWQTPTLCTAWTVHQMAAHLLVTVEGSTGLLVRSMIRARGNPSRLGLLVTEAFADLPSAELARRLRVGASATGAPPILGLNGPYADSLIHGEDIRVPLGLADDRPAERWRPVLDFLTTWRARLGFLPGALPGLWFQATDVEWQHGTGDVVSGPAAALALALTGRTARLDELDGPGKEELAAYGAR